MLRAICTYIAPCSTRYRKDERRLGHFHRQRAPADWLAIAQALAADHFVLGGVIAKGGFEPGAQPLDLVPGGLAHGFPPVAGIGQLAFQVGDRVVEIAQLGDIQRQGAERERAVA
jgi:uncharacterized SAM-binding protein YcdF (DUF218 family)